MRKSYLILILLLANSFLIVPLHVNAENNEVYSLGIHYLYSGSSNLDNDLTKIKNAGFQIIRTSFIWKLIEPYPNTFNFTYYDELVNKANSLGLRIIAILGMGTQDMLPSWVNGVDDPNYINYLSQYANAVVKRYASKVEIWQIENELNHVGFYKWIGWRTGNWSNEEIHNILSKLSQIVRENTQDKIMINVIVDNPNWLSFLKSINDINYDVIGLDYYPNYLDDYASDAGSPAKGLDIYNYILEARQFNKEIIVSETGYSTYNKIHNEENQALFLQNIVKGALFAGVKEVIFYQYKDQVNASDIEANFGLISYNGTPKLAWQALKNLTHANWLRIDSRIDGVSQSLPLNIDGIELNSSASLLLPSLTYSIKFPFQLNLTDHIAQLSALFINGVKVDTNNVSLNLTQDTNIEIVYESFFFLKIFLNINGTTIQLSNSVVYVNSQPYNYSEYLLLKKGVYNIQLPTNLTIAGRRFEILNSSESMNITGNSEITFNALPVYTLNIIVMGWFNEPKSATIYINGKSYQSSNLTLSLSQGIYRVSVADIYSQSQNVTLDKDTTIIFYVPEELILVPLLFFIALPFFFVARGIPSLNIKKYRIVLDCITVAIFYIIIPYYGIIFLSSILTQKAIIFYQLKDLLIFGIPIIVVKALKIFKKYALVLEAISIILITLYIIFIIGRAIYGEFGMYTIQYLSLTLQINIAPYVLLATVINALRGFVGFLGLYYSRK